jgi:hypothetical protein
MSDSTEPTVELIDVPEFYGMQALNAWLTGHDAGLLLEGPDPDSPEPLLHGIVIAQQPRPGSWLHRWDVVTVWLRDVPGLGGVPEPRRPYPPTLIAAAEITETQVGDERT